MRQRQRSRTAGIALGLLALVTPLRAQDASSPYLWWRVDFEEGLQAENGVTFDVFEERSELSFRLTFVNDEADQPQERIVFSGVIRPVSGRFRVAEHQLTVDIERGVQSLGTPDLPWPGRYVGQGNLTIRVRELRTLSDVRRQREAKRELENFRRTLSRR